MAREKEGQTVPTCTPREEEWGDVSAPVSGVFALAGMCGGDLKGGGGATVAIRPFREEEKGQKLLFSVCGLVGEARNH